MDFEDWGYIVGALLFSAGAGWLNVSAGLCCAGAFMAFPAILSIIRGGPPTAPKGN